MSLRTDIHLAFDDLAPSTIGMPERVVQSAHVGRAPKQPLRVAGVIRLRAPLSLVAVLLVIALVVGALVGGRLFNDWQKFHHRPVPVGVDQAQLHQLEARKMDTPKIIAGQPCSGPIDAQTGWWGPGPIYLFSQVSTGYGTPSITRWGAYFQFVAEVDPTLNATVLIRAFDLSTNREVLFVGALAAGPLAGSDVLSGQPVEQHAELAFNAGQPPSKASNGYFQWSFTAGVEDTSPRQPSGPATLPSQHCTAWRIDAPTFIETFVVSL